MKRPLFINSIELLLFFVLLAGALFFMLPISKSLEKGITEMRDSFSEKIEKTTGLKFSYKSLSPSIFRSLKFTDLVVLDAANGSPLAEISDVAISYDLFAVLRGDMSKAIKKITIQNGKATFDSVANAQVLKMADILSAGSNSSGTDFSASFKFAFPETPIQILVKNIDITYSDPTQKIFVHIGKGQASLEKKEIDFTLVSSVQYERMSNINIGRLDAGLTVKGSINNNFDAGSASIVLQNLEGNTFSISKLAMITSYRNGQVSINSVQDLQPVDFQLLWDLANKELSMSLICENLLPFYFVRIQDKNSIFGRLKDSIISGSAQLKLSGENNLEYSVILEGEVPYNVYEGGKFSLVCGGDAETLNIENAQILGALYNAYFSGTYNFKNMMPDGFLSVSSFQLPSGSMLSGDMYIENDTKKITILMPEFSIDINQYNSVSLVLTPSPSVIEFSLSAYDRMGHITADGSYTLGNSPFLQLYAGFDSVSVANMTGTVLAFVLPEMQNNVRELDKNLAPYAMTTEIYFSTDLTNLSFNCTRLVLASDETNGLYILLSAKGNETGIDITDIAFSRPGINLSGTIHAGFEATGDILFNSSITINAIPYTFSGLYSNQTLSLYGDYSLAVLFYFDSDGGIRGSLRSEGLPVPVGKYLFSASVFSEFDYQRDASWKIILKDVSMEEMNGLFPLTSVIRFQGSVDTTGIFLTSLMLQDDASSISGYLGINRISERENENRYSAELSLESDESKESYRLSAEVTFADEMFFQVQGTVNEVPLMRFSKGQLPNNRLSAIFSCTGTPSDILASADISRLLYKISGFDLDVHGNIRIENNIATLNDSSGSWNGQNFSDITGTLLLDSFHLALGSSYTSVLGESGISARIELDFLPETSVVSGTLADINKIFSLFTVEAAISDINWNKVIPKNPFNITLIHESGITAIYAGTNDAITGYLTDDGMFSLQSGNEMAVSFNAEGKIMESQLAITVNDFHADLPTLWPFTGLGIAEFKTGSIDGDFTISGLTNDPEFTGDLRANTIQVHAPGFIDDMYGPVDFIIFAEGKTFTAPKFILEGKNGAFSIDAIIELDRWVPSIITIKTATVFNRLPRINTENYMFAVSGFAAWNLDVILTPTSIDLAGDVAFERGSCAILFSGFSPQAQAQNTTPFDVKLNLNLITGRKVEFRWPTNDLPIIRGLIQADNPFKISLDSVAQTFQFKGAATLKGGEIFYLKRSFYLREGNIVFNENQDIFDPLLTFRAEIRERDESGEPVRIILGVENQRLSTFLPVLRSDPPKSESEILALLGQASIADTSRDTILKDTVVTASDILTQISLFRNAENKIRDFLGLDVFSIRTLILQNAILGPSVQTSTDPSMSIGNYFDNTTVYIGKYWGSAIYTDALMHFSYYDQQSPDEPGSANKVSTNLLFEPELGLEVTTPFFLLRWGINPSNFNTLWVEGNSVTLSWKFSY